MKTEFKAHPLMILKFIKPFLFILVIPVIKGIIQYVKEKQITGVLTLELLACSFIFFIAYIQLKCFKLQINGNKITVFKGFLIRRTATIKLEKLSSAVSIINPLDWICNSVTFRLNTEAGRRGKPDFEFKLSRKNAETVENILFGKENRAAIKYSLKRLILASALDSSAFSGLIIAVPVLNKMGDLFGIALSEMLFDELNTTAQKINTYFPPIFNLITFIIIIGYSFSFIYTLFVTLNFKLFTDKKHLEVNEGLLIRKKILFSRESVNDICVEQTPFMRLLNRYSMRASVGGFGDEKGEKALLIPIANSKEIKNTFSLGFKFLYSNSPSMRTMKSKKMFMRFIRIPLNIAVFTVFAGILGKLFIPFFDRFAVFVNAVILILTAYYASLRIYDYKHGKLQLGDSIAARGTHLFSTRALYCKKEKVGLIKVTQNPYDIRKNTCKVKIVIRSESADSLKIRNLNLDSVKENLNSCMN